MQHKSYFVNGNRISFLQVAIYDADDLREIRELHTNECALEISLCDLQYLSLFRRVEHLILTAGAETADGLAALYQQKNLLSLILDYIETDSDEDDIQLANFPMLSYVKSRSDLNIYRLESADREGLKIEVLDYYGVKKKRSDEREIEAILPSTDFLFITMITNSPAGDHVLWYAKNVEKAFLRIAGDFVFSDCIDSMGFVLLCFCDDEDGGERLRNSRRVSKKRRTADFGIVIPLEAFLKGSRDEKYAALYQVISKAAQYVRSKDDSFRFEQFMRFIDAAFHEVQ